MGPLSESTGAVLQPSLVNYRLLLLTPVLFCSPFSSRLESRTLGFILQSCGSHEAAVRITSTSGAFAACRKEASLARDRSDIEGRLEVKQEGLGYAWWGLYDDSSSSSMVQWFHISEVMKVVDAGF